MISKTFWGCMIQFDEFYFYNRVVQPPTTLVFTGWLDQKGSLYQMILSSRLCGLSEGPVFFHVFFFFRSSRALVSPCPRSLRSKTRATAMQCSPCDDDEAKKRLTYTEKTELMEEKCCRAVKFMWSHEKLGPWFRIIIYLHSYLITYNK